MQDAAYGTLLREPRRALHGRIAETMESQFTEIAENQPELLARHCTEAGLIEKAVGLWGKAGQRSLECSALREAAVQFTQALGLIAALPPTPVLRREQIKHQLALIRPLGLIKGFAAPETKAAVEQARLLIEQADALGEHPDDLLRFSALSASWGLATLAFNGDVSRILAEQFLLLAKRRVATVPLVRAHVMMGQTLLYAGVISEAVTHFDKGLALYDPADQGPLRVLAAGDARVQLLGFGSWAAWILGYPEVALVDADQSVKFAREIGDVGSLMLGLACAAAAHSLLRNHATTNTLSDELIALADEKSALYWKALGMTAKACMLAVSGKSSDAVHMLNSGFAAFRSTATTLYVPFFSMYLAVAYAELNELDNAWRCINETIAAIDGTKERWCEAEVNRIAGEISLKSPQLDTAKAEEYFEHALAVARQQQAKSWELRAAMSMARLWRDQGKRDEARNLLAPVYGWFTEGFDTLDLKEAKALLEELA